MDLPILLLQELEASSQANLLVDSCELPPAGKRGTVDLMGGCKVGHPLCSAEAHCEAASAQTAFLDQAERRFVSSHVEGLLMRQALGQP